MHIEPGDPFNRAQQRRDSLAAEANAARDRYTEAHDALAEAEAAHGRDSWAYRDAYKQMFAAEREMAAARTAANT
jgi:hypothetical protein